MQSHTRRFLGLIGGVVVLQGHEPVWRGADVVELRGLRANRARLAIFGFRAINQHP